MAEVKDNFGEGGAGLAPDGAGKPTLAQILRDFIDDLNSIQPSTLAEGALAQDDCVLDGGIASAPTTGSTQATGGGNLDWNVDVAAARAKVNGVEADIAVAADFDVHSGSALVANGESAYAWIVIAESGGSLAYTAVVGAAATTGSQVAPTDADIDTAVGDTNWAKLALCLINRTGDTTVTQSEDNTYREPLVGPLALALINALRTNQVTAAGATLKSTKG